MVPDTDRSRHQRNPQRQSTLTSARVKGWIVPLDDRSISHRSARGGDRLASDAAVGVVDRGNVPVVLKHRVLARRDLEMQKVARVLPETVHLGATQVHELAVVVRAVADADGNIFALIGNGVIALHEPLPLRGNVDGRIEGAALGEADDADDLIMDDTRRIETNIGDRPQLKRCNEREAVDTATLAHALRRLSETVAERARKGFVRTVAGLECDGENVGRAGRERPGRGTQTASTYVLHDRHACRGPKGMGQMRP